MNSVMCHSSFSAHNAFIGHDSMHSLVMIWGSQLSKKIKHFLNQSLCGQSFEFEICDLEILKSLQFVILSSCHPATQLFWNLFLGCSGALTTKSLFCIHKGIMVGPGLYISTGLRGNLRGSSQPMNELDFDFLSWLITRAVRERWFQETRRAEFHRHSQLSRGWLF